MYYSTIYSYMTKANKDNRIKIPLLYRDFKISIKYNSIFFLINILEILDSIIFKGRNKVLMFVERYVPKTNQRFSLLN